MIKQILTISVFLFFPLLAQSETVNGDTPQNIHQAPVNPSVAIIGDWCFDSRPQKISLDATRNISITVNSVRRESFRGDSHSQNYEYSHDKKILVLRDPQPESVPCPLPRRRNSTNPVVMNTCYPKELSAVYELQEDGRLKHIGLMLPYDPNWKQLSKTALISRFGQKPSGNELDTRYFYKRCSPLTS